MKRLIASVAVVLVAGAASLAVASGAFTNVSFDKLPKCAGHLCKDVNCSPDVLCSSGTTVKTCAEVCNNGH